MGVRRCEAVVPLRAVALALTFAAALPSSARAHLQLERSFPASGAQLDGQPREVRIRFTQAVSVEYTSIVVTRADGSAVAAGAVTELPGSERREFIAALPELGPGEYRVAWRTAGRDGHIVEGGFSFTMEAAKALDTGRRPPPRPDVHAEHGAVHDGPRETLQVDPSSTPVAVLVRWLNFAALLCMIGAVSFRALVLPRVARRGEALFAESDTAVWRFARAAAAAGVVALLARLYMQSRALHGAREALSLDRMGVMLSVTGWGHAWGVQALGLAAFLAGLALALRRSAGWALAAGGATVMAFVPALSGHAAATEGFAAGAIVLDGLHVIGASVWLGTLAALLLAGLPAAWEAERRERGAHVAALVRAFSPIALTGAALAAGTGTVTALLHLDLSTLTSTAYGRTLLIKLAVLTLVVGAGFYNWRFVTPALGRDVGAARLRRSAAFEVVVAGLVLAVTAVLVALPTP